MTKTIGKLGFQSVSLPLKPYFLIKEFRRVLTIGCKKYHVLFFFLLGKEETSYTKTLSPLLYHVSIFSFYPDLVIWNKPSLFALLRN